MARRKTHAQQIAAREVKAAQDELGAGWRHVSRTIQEALVTRNIFYVVLGQDEAVPAARVLEYARELVEAARDILDKTA